MNDLVVNILTKYPSWYPRPTFIPTQLGLGITQAIHCEVIQVSTVYYAVCFPQTVYCSTWLTWDFRHLIVLMLLSAITRNHSTNNACCCVRLRMMTGPSIYDLGPVFERLQSMVKFTEEVMFEKIRNYMKADNGTLLPVKNDYFSVEV